MKRFVLVALCLFLAWGSQAQINRGLKGKYNVDNYPEVSFIWNSPNPAIQEASQFILSENDVTVPIKVRNVKPEMQKQKKSVLVIWEDMASHGKQSDFTRNLLNRFFSETSLDASDQFNIAVFNRKQKNETKVLKPLLTGFTADKSMLTSAATNHRNSKLTFAPSPNNSDLYQAINEGVELLKKEPADRAGVIIVVTRGLNLKAAGASTEMETVRKNALDAGIPLYVVKYTNVGDAPEVNTLAESTYGTYINTQDVATALSNMQQFYGNLDKRLYGQDYEITFTTGAKRDGKPHNINLSINKVPQQIPAFTAPNITFGLWVKENLILFICLCLLLVLLIVLAIVLIVKRNEKHAMELQMSESRVQDAINHSNQEMNQLRQQQAQKEQERLAAEQRKIQEAEAERLLNLMRTKNLYPRLQCKVGDTVTAYTISKPVTRLGRNANNDVVLNNQTVSGAHAEIRFNGAAFEVVNRSHSYTQGIIVNGQFFQQTTLKNGDIIGLGEAVVTFYM